jgi:hypothetical protein
MSALRLFEMIPTRPCQVCVQYGEAVIHHNTAVGKAFSFQTLFSNSVCCGFIAHAGDGSLFNFIR